MVAESRIQARAIGRAGEILAQIEPANGANQNIGAGDVPNVLTRTQAAEDAGMSDRQRKTALRVASIDKDGHHSLPHTINTESSLNRY